MTEGGDLLSMKDGSDTYFECTCTPCEKDNIREEAVKYCPECQEYLCVTCVRYHSRLKAYRSHILVEKNDPKQGSVVTKTTKCRYHPDRDIEMYCGTHDMVYCTKCIATEHRSCRGKVGIEELQTSKVQQTEIKRLQDETRNIHESFVTVHVKKRKNLDCLEKQRNAILEQLHDTEQNLIEHIRTLKVDTTNALNKHYSDIRDELNSDITGLSDTKQEIEKLRNQLDTVSHMDAGQTFVQMKLIQSTVADTKKLIENNKSKGTRSVSFTENTDLRTSIITATCLGQVNAIIERQSTPGQHKVKSKKQINVKMQSDRNTCYIIDVCQLQDGTILLTDGNNNNIKRLDVNYNVRDHCDLDDYPSGICCTGRNEIAVKTNNDKIQFISVGTSFSKLRDISVVGGGYLGMTYCGGELWVSTGSGINIYSTSGSLLQSITKDENGRKIFKDRTRHMTVSGVTVIVTDDSDGAVCLGRDGMVKQKFRDGRLVNTTGASVSDDGTVFLSGRMSNNIMMFSLDGKCLVELVSKDYGLVNPIALCFDNKRMCMIVTCVSSDTIHILMCDYK